MLFASVKHFVYQCVYTLVVGKKDVVAVKERIVRVLRTKSAEMGKRLYAWNKFYSFVFA